MHPKPGDRPRPGPRDRGLDQEASGARPDRLRRDPEEGDLAGAGVAEVEFEDADVGAVGAQRQGVDRRIGEDRAQLRLRHDEPAEPEPGRADAAEQGAIAFDVAPDRRQYEASGGSDRPGWGPAHLEESDDGRDLVGRQVGIPSALSAIVGSSGGIDSVLLWTR